MFDPTASIMRAVQDDTEIVESAAEQGSPDNDNVNGLEQIAEEQEQGNSNETDPELRRLSSQSPMLTTRILQTTLSPLPDLFS